MRLRDLTRHAIADLGKQGYEILDEEINIPYDDWANGSGPRPAYVGPDGAPMYDS